MPRTTDPTTKTPKVRNSYVPAVTRDELYKVNKAIKKIQKMKKKAKKENKRVAGVGRDVSNLLSSGYGLFNTARKGLGSIVGLGAYTVNGNTLTGQIPQFMNKASSELTIIKHREYIGDVLSSVGFESQYVLPINPGVEISFPWLSGMANNYTQYVPLGIIYEYVPTSGSAIASTNNALGEVMMATQYDSIVPTFTYKQQMLNEQFSVSSVPSEHCVHPIECAPSQTTITKLYTRNVTPPPNADIRLYDLGSFTLATSGQQQAGVTLGELYVVYEFGFLKPTLPNYGGASDIGANIRVFPSIDLSGNVSLFTSTPTVHFDNIGLSFSNNTVFLPSGWGGNWEFLLNGAGSSNFFDFGVPTYGNFATLNTNWGQTTTGVPGSAWNNSGIPGQKMVDLRLTSVINPNLESFIVYGGYNKMSSIQGNFNLQINQLPQLWA